MLDLSHAEWRDHLILSRELATPGERSAFFGRARKGEFVAVARGVYVTAEQWAALDQDARYRARVKAAAAAADRMLVFSHHSATAIWELPWVGAWPEQVHVVDESAVGGRSTASVVRHTVGIPQDTVAIDGLAVTSLARTIVDMARVSSFAKAVTVADAALRRTRHPRAGVPRTFLTRDDLDQELGTVPLRHGSVKARQVIEFADGAADRPGESLSRANMRIAGLTMPQLQVPIAGASGRIYYVDFWWPEFNLAGEFDGKGKYTDPAFMQGRTPEQVLYDEKLREDDIRRADHGMSRWPWHVAISPTRLAAHLRAAGVR
ncbi:hypothetical protein [Salinibacterium sp. ZJ454]|uniref:hypothetical protein n=1 Tax=Salinibacterium sp. ZJ454 TaxID=2708339 RepID=UPI001421217F|nr:hypothetical protein [Salinibacterium sp. ZJ454]